MDQGAILKYQFLIHEAIYQIYGKPAMQNAGERRIDKTGPALPDN
jgi:hypothetical protein